MVLYKLLPKALKGQMPLKCVLKMVSNGDVTEPISSLKKNELLLQETDHI